MDYVPPTKNLEFILFGVLDIEREWRSEQNIRDLDQDLVRTILQECANMVASVMSPLYQSADAEGAHWREGEVLAPSGFKDAFNTMVDGGWLGTDGNPSYGGQGLPKVVTVGLEEMFWGGNVNLWLYAALTIAAAYCIDAHADPSIRETYLPQMYEGKCTGAMALTESHAGTDLGMIRTRAVPQADGTYSMTGTKIFITSGDHDLAKNIVHLVLAKLPDSPTGTKGISLFLVPKFLVRENGEVNERNAWSSSSIEKKMGIHGSATCVIHYEGATGFLIGKPNEGLKRMFTMMNYARLSIGIQGLGLAERAYQAAAAYAKERLQGRSATGPKNTDGPADPIIEHGDVRRMLLIQRAYNEGSRAFSLFVALHLDRSVRAQSEEKRARSLRLVELLTPVAKAFITDRGMECVLLAQQCFGGHGYIREWGMEQIVRDIRISQIYEGTNGIQAMDLLGRRVLADGGQTLKEVIGEMIGDLPEHSHSQVVRESCDLLFSLTKWIIDSSTHSPELLGAIAVDYLDLVGHVIYGWLWVRMETADDGTRGKQKLADFYFAKLMPKIRTLDATIRAGHNSITTPESDWF